MMILGIILEGKQEMLQYVTDAPEGPLCDTPSHYALSFCEVSSNLLQ